MFSPFLPYSYYNGATEEYKGTNSPYLLDVVVFEGKKRRRATISLTRPPMYPFSTGQYPYPMLSPEMSQVAASWHPPTMYPLSPSSGFRSPYPSSLPISTSSLPTDFYSRFSPTGLMAQHHHAGLGGSPHHVPPHLPAAHHQHHAAIVTPGPKQELPDLNHRYARAQADHKNNMSDMKNNQDANNAADKKKPHIKKPLNAFMLYMKEMRAKVVAECTLKESAAINQILGRKWHSLSREEQAKYYEKARQERQLHMQLYPGWSARDNYGYGTKKKKRKKERTPVESGGNSMKKCRARYGLDQQSQWCKPCRRKKKCIRYMESSGSNSSELNHHHHVGDTDDGNQSDDNLGSCGSMGDAHTPPDDHCHDDNDDDDDTDSLNQSMSSPGGLSALSSLTSPGGVVLPSPSTSVASPSVSVASPYVMLPSPLTPQHHETAYDTLKPQVNSSSTSSNNPQHFDSGKAVMFGVAKQQATLFETTTQQQQANSNSSQHHLDSGGKVTMFGVSKQQQQPLFETNPQQHFDSAKVAMFGVSKQPLFETAVVNLPPPLSHPVGLLGHVRHPVGTNPHDVNNPLSVNQLTGQCVVKTEPTETGNSGNNGRGDGGGTGKERESRAIISVT